MKIAVLGIDLGKNVCSIVGLDASRAVVLRRRVRRDTLMPNSLLHAWFDQLASGKGLCCSFADGLSIQDVDTYGPDAIQVMTENPYRLARDITGIGFKTADAIAMKLGIEKIAVAHDRCGAKFRDEQAAESERKRVTSKFILRKRSRA